MGYSVRLGERRKPRALSVLEQDRLHNRLVRVTPSEPWRDHCKSVVCAGQVPYKTKIERELHKRGVFPPGGHATLMVHCALCGQEMWHPPQSVQAGCCDHCREVLRLKWDGARQREERADVEEARAMLQYPDSTSTTSSPHAAAVYALEMQGGRLGDGLAREFKLETESEEVLRRQLQDFADGKPTRLIQPFAGGA